MDVFKILVDTTPPPRGDEAEEEETVNRILALCEPYQGLPNLKEVGRITPWVAYCLSGIARREADQGELSWAVVVGAASVAAAAEAKSPYLFCQNLLDLAYILGRAGMPDRSAETYQTIIDLPLPEADRLKPLAHISLGSSYKTQWVESRDRALAREAVYHFERGLRYAGSDVGAEGRKLLLDQLAPLYRALDDKAGAVHWASKNGFSNPEAALREIITPEMSAEDVLALATRLHSLEEHRLAEVVFETWKGGQPPAAQDN